MSVFRENLFKGKVALVTGGGTGIGKAIATELVTLGCHVIISSRSLEKLEAAKEDLSKYGSVSIIQCNIRNEAEVRNTVSRALSIFGKLDYLVNNGGGQFPSPSEHISLKGWNAVIETNLTGTFLMSKEVYSQCFKANGGCIVNIICDMFKGFPSMSHTGAARAGVENLTRSMAIEWAESGVRVNAVAPGVVFSQTASDNYKMDIFSMAKPLLPTKRLGTTQEVSSAVCFLLSPGASFISGATIRVDGGSSLYVPDYWPIQEHQNLSPYEWTPKPSPSKL